MNVLVIVLGSGLIYVAAYFIYGKFLAKKVFRLDDSQATPAIELEDGKDFVPAGRGMLLGQHFSAIAAAVSALIAPCFSSIVGHTPSRAVFASFE